MEALWMDYQYYADFQDGIDGNMVAAAPIAEAARNIAVENGGIGNSAMPGMDFEVLDESVFLEPANTQAESSEADPLKDPVFNYISDMLMDEEDTDERTCMFIDCSGYQSMASELTQIISESSSSSAASESENATNKVVDSWIDELFTNDEVVDSGARAETRPPLSDEEYEQTMHKMMNEFEISSGLSAPPKANRRRVEEQPAEAKVDTRCLQSILEECSDFLKDAPGNDAVKEHYPWTGDLLAAHDQIEAGDIRNVEIDSKAIALEKAERQELHAELIECAQAVAGDNVAKAYELVNKIRDKVSPHGNGTQRMVFYFAEALVARITGTGALLYSAMASNKPQFHEMLKAYRLFTRYSPNVRISHYFCNQTILDETIGASRVHIIDYGILYGFVWPCLIKAFSARKGGPPHLRITGIDFPQPGFKPAERVEETGRRLADYAKQVGVPFEFQAIATTKWESVQASSLLLRHDEVLIVSSQFRLKHLLDESVMVDSPRKLVLSRIRNMKPKVLIQAVMNANYNAPFFLSRFREALGLYGTLFNVIDTAISPEYPERLLIEQSIIGREILNLVACEGQERVERAETYKQWQSRTAKAGFEQLPLRPEIYAKSRAMLGTYHKNFGIGQDGNWLLIGWKETVLHGMSTWRPL